MDDFELMMSVDDMEVVVGDLQWVIDQHKNDRNFKWFQEEIEEVISHLKEDIEEIENYVEPSDFNDDCCGGYPRYSDNIVAGY